MRHGKRSLVLRGLGMAAVLVLAWCAGTGPVRASACYFAENEIFIYYSNAQHTQIVGSCSEGPCPFAGCTGTKTSYYTFHLGDECEVCI